MRILFRFAFSYRYFQSQHTLFEKQESCQLESTGQYLSIKDGRPKEVSLTEVVTNTLVLIASAAGWGWSIGHATKSYRAGNGLDLSTVASVAGSTVMLLGALVVFAFQWGAMKTHLNYSQSILILDTMIFSRTGTAFFGRVFRDFDIVSCIGRRFLCECAGRECRLHVVVCSRHFVDHYGDWGCRCPGLAQCRAGK